jgi:hypothetical protein
MLQISLSHPTICAPDIQPGIMFQQAFLDRLELGAEKEFHIQKCLLGLEDAVLDITVAEII